MSWKEFAVTVPASTANLGPGFDSIGLALDLQMTIKASPSLEWVVEYTDCNYQHLSSGKDNLIVVTALAVAKQFSRQLPAAKLLIDSDIPLGKGLGSSAAAIAGGIEIADRLLGLELQIRDKVKIGSQMEGHPDNISASFYGGLTISYVDGQEVESIRVQEVEIGVVIMMPPNEFLTTESRGLLPASLLHHVATQGSAASNVLTAALVQGDWETAGRMMGKDTFHEPFRKSRFSDFDSIRQVSKGLGAYGSAISGAGPSLFIAVNAGEEGKIAVQLRKEFPHYQCIVTKPSSAGVKSFEMVI
ncbi:homoserine kinase [Paenisporosarcina indica]|uniref:homoserine kinase n=1 Tax=Paenisporosarcina indica TaxID=650093 RepID=UPI00094FEFFC|nr:homoserine kinase [Paenisporosarcina indica]